ncbi:flagellar motor stator protein MotA [Sulfurirhabdus autotrophica]|uniref:Chemotaxis protein MotA n=1 Tax=Sulfurirhabdus autotrophica TaxID=1706046 RepID=A0A4R3YEA4_9PROT|nr:flagellar motor stator protein MotA [Sulfurirhabdus autotrophica]TCV90192.1 chemotaxis protein MotA [Sulfurirhabdus autotrophica]
MFVIIGWVIVIGSVFGGFAMAGGHLAVLFQPLELLMIGGAAAGAFLVGNTLTVVKSTIKTLPTVFKAGKFNKVMYMDLLALLFEILAKVRKEGLMSIERDVESPHESPVFSKYPNISSDHHLIEFITDYLRLMVGGNLNAFEIENLMDQEMETHHKEAEAAIGAVAKLGDGLPAFGIVAAVMGVVHTMESVGIPPAELGILIAHALVGTFLGILLAYGFVGPLASTLEQKMHESSKPFECIKVTLLASLNGYAPQVAIEFGRKVLYSTDRPTFSELEEDVKSRKGK